MMEAMKAKPSTSAVVRLSQSRRGVHVTLVRDRWVFWGAAAVHRPRLRQMPRLWRIDLVSEEKTRCIGVVTAPDKEIAIKRACEKFDIVDTTTQRQLVARKL